MEKAMQMREYGRRVGIVLLLTLAPARAKDRPLELKGPDSKLAATLNLGAMDRLGTVAFSGTPSKLGGFVPAFDRRLDTEYEPQGAGAAQLVITFARPQTLTAVRLLPAEGEYEWRLEGAGSRPDLDGRVGSYRELMASQRRVGGVWAEVRWPAPVNTRLLRFTLTPISGGDRVRVREVNLEAEQELESISIRTGSRFLPVGERISLGVLGYFSGGETRPLKSKGFAWQINPIPAARIDRGFIVGRRQGPVEVRVSWGKLTSVPLSLQVVDPD